MRELFAVQLDIRERSDARAGATELLQEWIARRSGTELEELRSPTHQQITTGLGHELDVTTVDGVGTDSPAWTCEWRRSDDSDPGLVWRVAAAIGTVPPNGDTLR